VESLSAYRSPAALERLSALQKTAAAAALKISDGVGGRRNRKQPQAVRTDRDATKEGR
jgi:hypothetical protein